MSYLLKILVAGESFVGKTTLIQRFVADEFIIGIRNTIGVDFFLKQMQIESHVLEELDDQLDLQIWDISGEKRFREILPLYSSGTHGVILCFDNLTNFDKLIEWENVLQQIIPLPVPRVLLRTKADLDEILPEKQTIDRFLKDHNCIGFYNTSSKDGTGVSDAFLDLAKHIYKSLRS